MSCNGDNHHDEEGGRVVVAIDRDRASQSALKWATENVLHRGETVILLHIEGKPSSISTHSDNLVSEFEGNERVGTSQELQNHDKHSKEIFLPFRCFCNRKRIKTDEIILENTDIPKAIIEYTYINRIGTLVLGAPLKTGVVSFSLHGSRRSKSPGDIMSIITKGAPDFTTVFIISKGKVLSVRSASCAIPGPGSPIKPQQQQFNNQCSSQHSKETALQGSLLSSRFSSSRMSKLRFPFARWNTVVNGRTSHEKASSVHTSLLSSMRHRTIDPRYSPPESVSEVESVSFGSSVETSSLTQSSQSSNSSGRIRTLEEMQAEIWRLQQELEQVTEMYNAACNKAPPAHQKTNHQQVEDKSSSEDETTQGTEKKEKQELLNALEETKAELEAQKQKNEELWTLLESQKVQALSGHNANDVKYRRYTVEEMESATDGFSESLKIGEGGYGPVYRCTLDQTQVAIKVLRSTIDPDQGKIQFQQEIDVLSIIRHPNMVILMGACPENFCLVYEYMANGSLEDCLFRRGNNTPPLPWQYRFRIAAEIGTALFFLHQTKPDPLVHRDLKPANILLDQNYVSKISDVGLARLVPPLFSDTDSRTRYRMTHAAGTFCYIDPEYQQTGMLGTKSDVYSLGILLLQLITARPAMGLTHLVETAIESGLLGSVLDPVVPDWPLTESLEFAKLSLQCAELRRKDRPDLGKVVLPQLIKFREMAEQNMGSFFFPKGVGSAASLTEIPSDDDVEYSNETSCLAK